MHLQHLRTNYQCVFPITQGPVAPAQRVTSPRTETSFVCLETVLSAKTRPLWRPFKPRTWMLEQPWQHHQCFIPVKLASKLWEMDTFW